MAAKRFVLRQSGVRGRHFSTTWLAYALGVVALTVFASECFSVARGAATCESIQVISNELTIAEAEEYCRYAVRERKKVEEFWGGTWNDTIRIDVSSSYRISRSLVPGHFDDRGFMEMPLRRVRDNTGALLHEIVHIYAPNDNRFLAEDWRCTFMPNGRGILRSPTLGTLSMLKPASVSGRLIHWKDSIGYERQSL